MKSFLKFLTLVLLAALILPEAATVKRPLTPTAYGKQWRLVWCGGTAPVVTADDLVLYSDTANSYGLDPFYNLYKKKVSVGEENVFPGEKPPEKACVAITSGGDADGTSSLVYASQSTTRNGTFVRVKNTNDTMVTAGATKMTEVRRLDFNPFRFSTITIDPVSATDSIDVTCVEVWPCDD